MKRLAYHTAHQIGQPLRCLYPKYPSIQAILNQVG